MVSRIARTLVYPETRQTVGVLVDRDGRPVGEQLFSGRVGPAEALEGLRTDLPRKPHLWKSVREHVEGHAAAWMRRQEGNQHVVLVVSKEPCAGRQGCDRTLPHILRRGSSLTVYVAEAGKPVRYYQRYEGTGKGVVE